MFKRTGECLCTPVFFPTALVVLRVKLRTGFGIKVNQQRKSKHSEFSVLINLKKREPRLEIASKAASVVHVLPFRCKL